MLTAEQNRQLTQCVDDQRVDVDFQQPGLGAHRRTQACYCDGQRVNVGRRRAARALQQPRTTKLANFGRNRFGAVVSGLQPDILQHLDPDAAQADHQHGASLRVAFGAEHHFNARRGHCLDQHAIELQLGPGLADAGVQAGPGLAQGARIGDADPQAADLGLLRQLRGLRLQHDWVADSMRGIEGIGQAARRAAGRDGQT